MTKDIGASCGPGSREPSPEGLGPSGFDPSRVAAAELILSYCRSIRQADALEREVLAQCRAQRAAAKQQAREAITAVAATLSRGTRLEMAVEFYWADRDVPPSPVLDGLAFHPPTGFPRDGIPMLATGVVCPKCGTELIKASRQAEPFCRCNAYFRRPSDDCIEHRGLVRLTQEKRIRWLCRDSYGSPKGGDAVGGSVEDDSAGRQASPNLYPDTPHG